MAADPSDLEENLYLYAEANPTNRRDPSGLLSGLEAILMCFDLHSISHGVYGGAGNPIFVSVKEAIDTCKLAYSQDAWEKSSFDFSSDLPKSGHDLFGWYIFEHTDKPLLFDASQPLTQELSKSILINNIRIEYYLLGDTPASAYYEYRFNLKEQLLCLTDYGFNNKWNSLPISCVLGSFFYQTKTTDNGDSVGFRIDNRTDLESGTHIAGRFPGSGYGGSVEELLQQNLISADDTLFEVINQPINGIKVVSILKRRNQLETGAYVDSKGSLHRLGGGDMIQTYLWKEKRDPCNPILWWMGEPPEIDIWSDYQNFTVSPYR